VNFLKQKLYKIARKFKHLNTISPAHFLAQCQTPLVSVLVLLLVTTLLPSCTPKSSSFKPTLPIPQSQIHLMEEHNESLIFWWKNKTKDAIVIHIDPHDDFQPVQKSKVEKVKRLLSEGKLEKALKNEDIGEETLVQIGDWLYTAYKLGLIKKVVWIMPVGSSPQEIKNHIQQYARFTEKELVFTRESENIVEGRVFGCPFVFTNLSSLSDILSKIQNENLLFDLDMDFFPQEAKRTGKPPLEIMKEFLESTKSKRGEIKLFTISYSNEGFYTPLEDRYLGTLLKKSLTDPTFLQNLPSYWEIFLKGRALHFANHLDSAVKIYREVLDINPDFAQAHYNLALLLAQKGKFEKALLHLREATEIEPPFKLGYIAISKIAYSQGEYPTAEKLLKEALKKEEDIDTLVAYGDFLFNTERYEEAASIYEKVASLRPEQDTDVYFYWGDSLALSGDIKKALSIYEVALKMLEKDRFRTLTSYPTSIVILEEIYKSRGEKEKADRFEKALKELNLTPEEEEKAQEIRKRIKPFL
jgi:tetratricopeptide (TPR) repeat protein